MLLNTRRGMSDQMKSTFGRFCCYCCYCYYHFTIITYVIIITIIIIILIIYRYCRRHCNIHLDSRTCFAARIGNLENIASPSSIRSGNPCVWIWAGRNTNWNTDQYRAKWIQVIVWTWIHSSHIHHTSRLLQVSFTRGNTASSGCRTFQYIKRYMNT